MAFTPFTPPYEVTQHGGGDSVYEKNLNKGDGTWAHEKEIIVWIFNGQDHTLRLPEEKNRKILAWLQNIKRFTTKTLSKVMEKLAGSLHHASFGTPGGAGLFSPIQVAPKGTSQWLRVTPDLTQCLQDWGAIIKQMGRHTTKVRQLLNNLPHYIGYSYSCVIGTGGVCTSGLNKIGPIMWKEEWPQKLKDLLN